MRIDPSLSCVGLPAIDLLTASTPAPGPAIATPVVSTAASLAGDTRPTYSIDFSEPRPAGGGIGDTLEARWGTSLSAMTAMTPESVTITEGMFVDGDDPFPELGDFAGLQSLGTTIYFSFRVVRGADLSDWSNTGTLLLVDGTMDAPVLTDLTGQATDARVWSALFSVAGLASGAWARLEGTGPIRVGGTTVYEAGTQVQVQNGASVEFGVDTASGGGATVDNVVSNRGVTLETFSATTAGTSVQLVVGNHRERAVGFAASSYTFGSNSDQLSFPAVGRRVVAISCNNRNITAVTIDGVAATRVIGVANSLGFTTDDLCIWEAPGDAAESVNVVVTAPGTLNRLLIQSFVLENAAAGTGQAVKDDTNAASHNVGSVTVPANGLGMAFAMERVTTGANAYAWSNATEFFDVAETDNTLNMSGAWLAATATPSCTFGGGNSNVMMAAASWDNA